MDDDLLSTHNTKLRAIESALKTMKNGSTLFVCRGDGDGCPPEGKGCTRCVPIVVVPGLTPRGVLETIRKRLS